MKSDVSGAINRHSFFLQYLRNWFNNTQCNAYCIISNPMWKFCCSCCRCRTCSSYTWNKSNAPLTKKLQIWLQCQCYDTNSHTK